MPYPETASNQMPYPAPAEQGLVNGGQPYPPRSTGQGYGNPKPMPPQGPRYPQGVGRNADGPQIPGYMQRKPLVRPETRQENTRPETQDNTNIHDDIHEV
ncbi:MAG TPA: hypothetical protein DCG37_03385 [Lachnospiraceae bacterium]|nr:hypothetical protein [Lachnospiraceae bacterium]